MNMEDFTPEKRYRPEDEYESLEGMTEQLSPAQEPSPAQEAAEKTQPLPYSAQPFTAQTNYTAPNQQTYPQQAYPGQATVQQPVYQQPVQRQMPPQPAYPYPAGGYPQQNAYSQQPYQNPPAQPPYPQPYRQEPVGNNLPLSPNPYVNSYQPHTPVQQPVTQPKPPTPTGTKVFIIVLCALLLAMVVGFGVYIATTNSKKSPESGSSGFSIDKGNGGDNGYEINPFGSDLIDNNSSSYTEVEDEITLKADNGETHKRDDDNKNSVGEPDENAKNITLNPLPKDKDDAKYTTQSAYDAVSDSVATVVCYKEEITDNASDIAAQGTATVISADGYLITNAHVLGNSRVFAVNIVMNNGDKYPAKIVGYDSWSDLAVLKVEAKDLKPVTFGDSKLIKIGDDVIAIGSPGGEKFQNSLTKGIVSALDREIAVNKYVRYIQSDAAISPGSSGGPLCNIYGQVIGITTAKTVAQNYENMSFSIPSATVEEIVGDLMRYGYVKGRTRIGITGTEVSAEEAYYGSTPAGVIISEIDESGSVAGSKIQPGDIITELDGTAITSFQDIYDVLADHKEGDKISIKVQRPSN